MATTISSSINKAPFEGRRFDESSPLRLGAAGFPFYL